MKIYSLIAVALLLVVSIVVSGCVESGNGVVATATPTAIPTAVPSVTPSGDSLELQAFSSWGEAALFVKEHAQNYGYAVMGSRALGAMAPTAAEGVASAAKDSNEAAQDYSTTNVQVAGVDEADLVKTDGKYVYAVVDGQVVIIAAFPPSAMRVVAVINDSQYSEVYIAGGRLVTFGATQFDWTPFVKPLTAKMGLATGDAGVATGGVVDAVAKVAMMPPYWRSYSQVIKVFDVNDAARPVELKNITFEGNLVSSRMVGSKVYAVFSSSAGAVPRPVYAVDGVVAELVPGDILHLPNPDGAQFTTVLGIDVNDLTAGESKRIVLTGYGGGVYSSKENLYVTNAGFGFEYAQWEPYYAVLSPLPEGVARDFNAVDAFNVSKARRDGFKLGVLQDYLESFASADAAVLQQKVYEAQAQLQQRVQRSQQTFIHKFALGGEVAYLGAGSVPGRVLNQFSMDEKDGKLRIATTLDEIWVYDANGGGKSEPSLNNVYVLDEELKIIGRLEALAAGERIYSARFLGDRAFLVTFKRTDPLFVLDLTDAYAPKVLGELKIPGYSDYLHPFDENHLIGLGKDADENGLVKGVKLSLFDVTDVTAPKETASFKIGDRGTESYALHDHKAFLFNAARNLLVIPVTVAEINASQYRQVAPAFAYGDYVFQGAYVFNVTLDGFELRGRVSHSDGKQLENNGWYWDYATNVKRALYIGDFLYTLSDKFLNANGLATLERAGSVGLPAAYPVPMPEFRGV